VKQLSLARRALIVAVAATASLAMIASGEEDKASSADGSGTTISKGLGSKDASADVTEVAITREGETPFTLTFATATLTNNSSKPSDYFVTIAAESPDGATRYGETIVHVMNLEPGQSSTQKGLFTVEDVPADAVAVVKEVQRTASA
jgi:hypothetical protein